MTHREIVIRLAEAYIKAGQSINASEIIKIADYFMAHTNDSTYNTAASWFKAINDGYVPSMLYSTNNQVLESNANTASVKTCATNEDLYDMLTSEVPSI